MRGGSMRFFRYRNDRSAFHLPDSLVKSNIAILIDTQLMIRNYYQLDDQAQLRNLVLHYPVFLSLKK